MPGNFSFILPGKLAGSARPGMWSDLGSDLSGLARQGIRAIVTLTEDDLDAAAVRNLGFRHLHLPIPDFRPPSLEQMREFVEFVDACLADNVAVVAHCGAGMGRTGTMLAAYLVAKGASPADAVRKVRGLRPGSIETPEQEESLERFREYLRAERAKGGKRG